MKNDIMDQLFMAGWRCPAEYHGLITAAGYEIKHLREQITELQQTVKYLENNQRL